MRINKSKSKVKAHIGNGHTLRFGVKSIGSNAEKAKAMVGFKFPISKNSTIESKSITCTPNVSGQSAWFLLECGVRVCVQYKDWKPILWIGNIIKEDENNRE